MCLKSDLYTAPLGVIHDWKEDILGLQYKLITCILCAVDGNKTILYFIKEVLGNISRLKLKWSCYLSIFFWN
jgi:hypothetical protein